MPRFVQLNGSRPGTSYAAEEGAILGRDQNCELRLKDNSISRRHARLIFLEGDWQLIDMGSRNGLRLDGRKIEKIVLRGGEQVNIGKLSLRFHLDSGEDWERKEESQQATNSGDGLTSMLQQSNSSVREAPIEPQKTVAERRAERIAEIQGEPDGDWISGDLLQRAGWVRWLIYLLVTALAVGACVGAFMLAQALRS
ncbi:MAG: pSer/pThr/pTyr-binding forkhead associated (FHA) protein [Planctomycetota bacterium]|jgi:pSer/pThr/pTyr-binding forkhead associated (FHA) protein